MEAFISKGMYLGQCMRRNLKVSKSMVLDFRMWSVVDDLADPYRVETEYENQRSIELRKQKKLKR